MAKRRLHVITLSRRSENIVHKMYLSFANAQFTQLNTYPAISAFVEICRSVLSDWKLFSFNIVIECMGTIRNGCYTHNTL